MYKIVLLGIFMKCKSISTSFIKAITANILNTEQ